MASRVLKMAAVAAACGGVLFGAANAALVKISVSGQADAINGMGIDPSEYGANAVFDISFIYDTATAVLFGADTFPGGASMALWGGEDNIAAIGLKSASIGTSLGTITHNAETYVPGDPTALESSVTRQSTLSTTPITKVLDTQVYSSLATLDEAFSGDLAGREAFQIGFYLTNSNPDGSVTDGTVFSIFDDLLSGISTGDNVNLNLAVALGLVSGGTTSFEFNQVSISLLGAPDPSEVPIPGALLLMLSGMAGLGFAGKRKNERVSQST